MDFLTAQQLKIVHDSDVIMMCGLPGSGKSYFAQKIQSEIGGKRLYSDAYRKKILGTSHYDVADEEVVRKHSAMAYQMMYDDAAALIQQGEKVILDATHLNQARAEVLDHLQKYTNSICMIIVHSSDEAVEARMSKKDGYANENETFAQACNRIRSNFKKRLAEGNATWPNESEGVKIIEIHNEYR